MQLRHFITKGVLHNTLLIGVLLLGRAVAAPPAEASPEAKNSATESGKKALSGNTRFPWYDTQRDDLRRIDVRAPKKNDDTQSSQVQPTQTTSAPISGTSTGWSIISDIVTVLVYVMLFAFIVAAIVLLVRAFIRRETRVLQQKGDSSEEELISDVDRVEKLPFKVAAPKGDMLSEAERCYLAGDYNSAIIYLFSYELMQLDRAQIIRLTRGKTNRQYVREAQSRRELAAILRNTMLPFEDVFFGHHVLHRERFEDCWRELQEFQRLVGNATEVAA